MTALNVRHVGVVTKDLNKSLKFYRDVLGFKVVKKMRETDRSLSDLMGLKKVQVTTVKMRSKETLSKCESWTMERRFMQSNHRENITSVLILKVISSKQ